MQIGLGMHEEVPFPHPRDRRHVACPDLTSVSVFSSGRPAFPMVTIVRSHVADHGNASGRYGANGAGPPW